VIVVDGVASGGAGSSPRLATEWVRYNDYGIGLLLEGDTRGAATAFSIVEALRPDISDGPLNLAKTALAAGDLADAYAGLERAEEISTGDARAAWVWGRVLQEDGRYEESVLAYQRVLEVFPEDRATWRAMGRTLFLDQQFERALESLAEVLRIDPEDRVAHYHRMLSLRALGRDDEADLAEAAYLYYAIDESAQAITRAYRARDAGANIMAQPIPTHRLEIRR
jgi:tetratricopeptide (TPR) repeat protein